MKILLFTKKNIICFIIILITILALFSCIFLHLEDSLACNSEVSDDFSNKVHNLTNENEKIAYLTFDDGPTTSVTPKILDILKNENVPATFFVIGKSVEEHPEIVRLAYEEGHYIANHGYSHNNSILYKSSENFINEIEKTDLAIGKAIGIENYCSFVFRFPNGFMAPLYKSKKEEAVLLLSKMNYTYIDWNCLTKDSEQKYTTSQLLNNFKKSSKNKGTLVVLMHDTKDVNDSSLVLEDCILYLKSQGYEFRNFYSLRAQESQQ